MRLSFSLNGNIECEKICQGIQQLINKNANSLDPSRTLLVVDLITVTQEVDCYIPKLEHCDLDHNHK